MHSDPDPARQLPITVVTGFLGAGKTTLLRHILADPGFARTAVIINEFGEVPLDHELLETAAEDVVEVAGGCLCCTVRGDLSRAIRQLDLARRRAKVMDYERVILETTGLADPAPILQTLMTDPMIAHGYRLDGLVTLVDAATGLANLDRFAEAQKQVAMADLVLVSKADLAGGVVPAALAARLAALNPMARIVACAYGRVDPASIFDLGPWRQRHAGPAIDAWLGDAHADHHHHDDQHDPNRHGSDIRAFWLRHEDPVSARGLGTFLELLTATAGARLLRVKGIVGIDEAPDRPLVLHAVQHVVHEPVQLDGWPSADRSTRLVFIVRGIDPATIECLFETLAAPAPLTSAAPGPKAPA